MPEGKTSTFTIHHDRCDPRKWTPDNVLLLARFLEFGDLTVAASLSRLGVQLVMSEHHVPKGGTLEQVGFMTPDCDDLVVDDLGELVDGDYTPVVRVYRGPVEYAIGIPIGDNDGCVEGYEYETKATEEEAEAYVKSMYEHA